MICPILPIPRGQKGPRLKDWQNLTPEQLDAASKRQNGGNRGIRLDNYAVLDPDSKAANMLCEQWEREGKIPPTVAWRTAAGNIKRLFQRPPELQGPLTIRAIKLQLRTGAGMQDVIPPSYVNDPEKGIDGFYAWLPDQDPESIEPAALSADILKYFQTHAQATANPSCTHSSLLNNCNPCASRLDFSQGGRDESLFHVANVLRKGGMAIEDAKKVIEILAKNCYPEFSFKTALDKINSAWKKEISEINLAAEVREWVLSSSGIFLSSDVVKELGLSSMSSERKFNQNLSNIFGRLVDEGILERGTRRGQFRRIEKESEVIDFASADTSRVFDLKWPAPFHLERLVNIYPKNIIMVAGASNAGKTALLLNVVRENMARHKVLYFSSEMGAEELRLRLEKFQDPMSSWRFDARERASNFADAVDPTSINIIDYFELTDNFYQVGGEIKKIFDRLTTGVAIIAIQKKEGQDLGRGGAFTLEKARLYLSMNPGELKVLKGKNWAKPGCNPNNRRFEFKLIDGCKFITA
jgi:hypothetical protein